jgi:glycosyltransferase involved in cell wall biosynthesis
MLLPQRIVENDEQWGKDFDTVVFDWKKNPWAAQQCKEYLSKLINYQISDDNIFDKEYRLIALIPAFNESSNIEECLKNVEKYCDGIILLDDESDDSTYVLAQSDKLLLKAKKSRASFDDKQNRNILLDLASFFRSEWFIFIDADERFDERFVDLPQVMDLPVDVVGVWIANLWDSPTQFRTNMPDTNNISQNGLWFRWRLFRNRGRMQIIGVDKLHFSSVPYFHNHYISKTVLLHLGYLDKDKREQKYKFYDREDKEKLMDYSYILSEKIELQALSQITNDYFKVKQVINDERI